MLFVWTMWNAKVLPCVGALQVCQCDSQNDLESLCVRPVERGSYFSVLVLPLLPFPVLFISSPSFLLSTCWKLCFYWLAVT